jgi:fructose-1,6-bisphosphatase/inositol monophosphatase family enzyme
MLPFDVADVLPIIREAGELGRGLQGRCGVELKADNTFVTDADRGIETLLRERLSTLTPGWSFLGEEQGLTGDPNAPAWVIDPIDGTNNFVRDLPLWTISIGAVHQGEPICGVVAAPVLDEISWAASGQGAWREAHGETQPIAARDRESLMHEDIIAYNTEVESAVDFSRVPGCMRNFGSLAYHLTLLARGSLCAALARRHKLYDIAGGMAICREAGCGARYLDGREWFADLTAPKEAVPLLVAPPQTTQLLSGVLALKQSPSALLGHEANFGEEPARS